MATRSAVMAIGPSIIAAGLMATLAALSIGTASAQYPIGQGQVPVYSPPPVPQQPVWSAPVTGRPAPYMPPPQSTYSPPPVYSAPVTGTVNPYPRPR
jgi:cutinase